jgi:hypothetical protein
LSVNTDSVLTFSTTSRSDGTSAVDLATIVTSGLPILCLDTCSILDIMRDLNRETVREHESVAAHDLLTAMESNLLISVIAPQVTFEIGENSTTVEDEANKGLAKLRRTLVRIDGVIAAFGGRGRMETAHLDGHVTRARALVDRWIAAATPIDQPATIADRALRRLNDARTPSRKGKESTKDCVIIENYIDFVDEFRKAGGTSKAVFVSSNTKDYAGDVGVTLKSDLAVEFTTIGLEYAPNLSAAKHSLGL